MGAYFHELSDRVFETGEPCLDPRLHILAICHFNENLNRRKRQSKDGKPYYNVTLPKFKLGDEVVREVAVPPTYSK